MYISRGDSDLVKNKSNGDGKKLNINYNEWVNGIDVDEDKILLGLGGKWLLETSVYTSGSQQQHHKMK